MRFTLSAFAASALWWAIGAALAPDPVLHRSPASLVVALLTGFATAQLSRPIYRRSAAHLLWLAPVSVYFAAASFGYLLPLVTEQVDVLQRCLEMVRTLCVGVTLTTVGVGVFPAAFVTHWLLRRVDRRLEPPRLDQRAA
jgi:uncharacterized protein involved in response to NO